MAKHKPHLFETFFSRMLPFDHLTIIYCWAILILTVNFGRPLHQYLDILTLHAAAVVVVILLVWFTSPASNPFARFLRLLYPVVMMLFFYQACGKMMHFFFPDFFDHQIVGLEKVIFGVDPSLWLDGRTGVVLTEIFSAGYFSYYFLIPGLALIFFFHGHTRENKRFMTATCLTFFVSYLMFIFYPIEGPRFYFDTLYTTDLVGPFFRPLVDMVIDRAAIRGGAMPSSHVAEALVVMIFALRAYGRKAYFLVPIVITLALGTVYGRFHYATDVVVGAVIGALAAWAAIKLYPPEREAAPDEDVWEEVTGKQYVSDNL
jgi:membrane-associated phospholipid phosphatase